MLTCETYTIYFTDNQIVESNAHQQQSIETLDVSAEQLSEASVSFGNGSNLANDVVCVYKVKIY